MLVPLQQDKKTTVAKTRRILCIEDEPAMATIVEYSLRLFAQWQPTTATGREALAVAKTQPWDAILLEIGLSGGVGLRLYDQLVHYPSPLILLTSRVMPSDLRTYQQMDCAGVIAKPFDPVTLGSTMANLLGWPDPVEDGVYQKAG